MTDPTDDTPDLARAVEDARREWASRFLDGWKRPYFSGDQRDALAPILRGLDAAGPPPPPTAHRPDRATQPTEAALTDPFITISTALDTKVPDLAGTELQMWRRVKKVCEESGEVWRALSGYVGENPRKGVTHTLDDLLGELLDTASAALCAWAHLNGNQGDPVAALHEHVAGTAERLSSALAARTQPTAEPRTDYQRLHAEAETAFRAEVCEHPAEPRTVETDETYDNVEAEPALTTPPGRRRDRRA